MLPKMVIVIPGASYHTVPRRDGGLVMRRFSCFRVIDNNILRTRNHNLGRDGPSANWRPVRHIPRGSLLSHPGSGLCSLHISPFTPPITETKAHRSVRVRSMTSTGVSVSVDRQRHVRTTHPGKRARGVTVGKHSNEPFLPSVVDGRPVGFPNEAVPCYQSVFSSATCCQLTCPSTQMSSRHYA